MPLAVLVLATALPIAVLLASGQAHADVDGNTLLQWCQSEDREDRAGCTGYIEAVTDILQSHAVILGYQACVPTNATYVQARDVVVTALVGKPAERHFSASGLTARALSEAFPCNN